MRLYLIIFQGNSCDAALLSTNYSKIGCDRSRGFFNRHQSFTPQVKHRRLACLSKITFLEPGGATASTASKNCLLHPSRLFCDEQIVNKKLKMIKGRGTMMYNI
jgi:hypothetical protein